MKFYTRGVILVVANPVDVLTYLIQKWSGLPAGRVLGTGTALDSSRFRTLLNEKLGVDIANVHGYMIGEHGDAMLPLWSATNIAGQSYDEALISRGFTPLTADEKAALVERVQSSGADVIKYKGVTNYAIAVVANNICAAILKSQNAIKTVTSVIDGPYGITGVALSLPSVVSKNGIEQVLKFDLTEPERDELNKCVEKMKIFLSQVQE